MRFLKSVAFFLATLLHYLHGESVIGRTNYKLWKCENFEAWKGDKYFEEVSKTTWYETQNKKVLREYRFISRNELNEVILVRTDGSFYIKLTQDMAKWGKSETNIDRNYERGRWMCGNCRLPSKNSSNNFQIGQFSFTILNDLEYPIDLKWIDFSGDSESTPFTTIIPGEEVEQHSHFDQRWALSNDDGFDTEIHLGIGYFRNSKCFVRISQIE